MTEAEYTNGLFTNWCECSPYGEQVPDEWPELMADFVKEHAGKDRHQMAELIMEAAHPDPFERLLESIFKCGAAFVLHDLANAAYDSNSEKLKLIGISQPPR